MIGFWSKATAYAIFPLGKQNLYNGSLEAAPHSNASVPLEKRLGQAMTGRVQRARGMRRLVKAFGVAIIVLGGLLWTIRDFHVEVRPGLNGRHFL